MGRGQETSAAAATASVIGRRPTRGIAAVALALAAASSAPSLAGAQTFFEPYDCDKNVAEWETKWSQDQQTWCCAEKSKGCQPSHPFDCQADVGSWQYKWSYAKKIFCCRQSGFAGCPDQANVPQQAAPLGNALASRMKPVQEAFPSTTRAPAGGCDAACVVEDNSHSCSSRVTWSAVHIFKEKAEACDLAMQLVVQQCPHCGSCSVSGTGCHAATGTAPRATTSEEPLFKDPLAVGTDDLSVDPDVLAAKRESAKLAKEKAELEEREAAEAKELAAAKELLAQERAKNAARTAEELRQRNEELADAEAERLWHQQHARPAAVAVQQTAAPTQPPLKPGVVYDCHAGTFQSMKTWSLAKMHFCCTTQRRACDLMPSTPAATTQPPAQPPAQTNSVASTHVCTGPSAKPVATWTTAQKDWCCRYHNVACDAQVAAPEPTTTPAPAPVPVPAQAGFDGRWVDKRGNSLLVSGHTITWPATNRNAKITTMSDDSMTMSFAGGEYHAKYLDGKLVWDVDDVWKRVGTDGSSEKVVRSEHSDASRGKVSSVLSSIDKNHDGHLNYQEISFLQQSAHVGHIQQSTYEQLCKQFGEDPSVGLGVETLTSIYSKSSSGAAGLDHTMQKFLDEQAVPVPQAAGAWTSTLLVSFGLVASAVGVAGFWRRSMAVRRNPRDAFLGDCEAARKESGSYATLTKPSAAYDAFAPDE